MTNEKLLEKILLISQSNIGVHKGHEVLNLCEKLEDKTVQQLQLIGELKKAIRAQVYKNTSQKV